MKNIKFVILGPSSSGKTTIGNILKEHYLLPIFECDDETRKLNKGYWPRNEKVVDTFFTRVNNEVLQRENVVYITSYLDKNEILQFVNKGFKILFLYADFDFLLKRRLKRENVSSILLKRFKHRYTHMMELVNLLDLKKHFLLRIDVSQSTNEQIAHEIFICISQSEKIQLDKLIEDM